MSKYLFREKFDTPCEDLFIVEAETADEAYYKAAKALYQEDTMFIDEIFCRAVNMSFAERFFLQTDKELAVFSSTGEIIIDDDEFIARVKAYFGSYVTAAEKYLSFWFLEGEENEVQVAFNDFVVNSEDFLIQEWIKFTDYEVLDISEIRMI